MDIIVLLNLILIIVVILIMVLAGLYFWFIIRAKKKKEEESLGESTKEISTFHGMPRESIYRFMEFDEIKDNMIIRKNRQQYVMVIQCQGVNYDLLSEDEKVAVEEGFVQFLNTLRFPIQLYIQTRSLNLREIVEEYKERVEKMKEEIESLTIKIEGIEKQGIQSPELDKLRYERRRKENVLEYGSDIAEYVGRLSLNKNVLQQKNYVVVSYFAAEFSGGDNYSKEEIDNICFGELYTRCQSVIRSLSSSSVLGKVLNSEELAELLYIAYNRDESEIMQLSKALDAQYDALYSTAKDVLRKKEEQIEEKLELEAVNLATESLLEADRIRKKELSSEEKKKKVKEKALQMIEEYRDQMDDDLYEETKKEIARQTEDLGEKPQKKKETNKTKAKKGE